jgi:hypothetical protein
MKARKTGRKMNVITVISRREERQKSGARLKIALVGDRCGVQKKDGKRHVGG